MQHYGNNGTLEAWNHFGKATLKILFFLLHLKIHGCESTNQG